MALGKAIKLLRSAPFRQSAAAAKFETNISAHFRWRDVADACMLANGGDTGNGHASGYKVLLRCLLRKFCRTF